MNPLPVEYAQNLPALIAPTIEQVREMFPPLSPIQLSDSCIQFLDKTDEFAKILGNKFFTGLDEKELVEVFVQKYGRTIKDVAVNPQFSMSSKEDYELFLRIKEHMKASRDCPDLMDILASTMQQLNFPAMCRDLIARYESARFDVNDYLLFFYGRKPKQVMVYGYKMPDYRFVSNRNTVVYDCDLNIINDGGGGRGERNDEMTPGFLLAQEWAEKSR